MNSTMYPRTAFRHCWVAVVLCNTSSVWALPPRPEPGIFKTFGSVYTLDTGTNHIYRNQESPFDNPLPRETLPAQDDPESAWGPISGGFQLCLRFEKEVFQMGDPILASILVRNATDVFLGEAIGIPGSTKLFVTDEKGQEVRAKFEQPAATKGIRFDVWPGTQYKFKVPLSEFFPLDRPGIYYVSAQKQVGESRAAPNVIVSGTATIRIVAGSGTGTNTNFTPGAVRPGYGNLAVPPGPSLATGTADVTQKAIGLSPGETTSNGQHTVPPVGTGSDGSRISAASGGTSHAPGSQARLIIAVVGFAIIGLLLAALLRRRRS